MDDLDPVELQRYRALCGSEYGDDVLARLDDEGICRALRVLDNRADGLAPTLGAILMFGREEALRRWLPTVEAQFQVRSQTDELRRNDSMVAPLFATMDWLTTQVAALNDEQEVMVGLVRVAVQRLSPVVVREAIANALVHRDYSLLGSVRITVGSEQMTVVSPGGFPRGVRLDNLLETSVPRSPILADAFKRAGLVERAGRGVSLIYRTQLLAGRDAPSYERTTAEAVTVDVPTSDADLDMVRFVTSYEDGAARALPLDQVRVLHELKHGGRTSTVELSDALHLAAAKVRTACTKLVERGLVEQIGAGRSRSYTLGPAFYTAAEDRNAYVRVRAADPVQQRRMIEQYVAAYGSITRGQVMRLCSVSTSAARALLRTLVNEGRLELRGERRTAHYVLTGGGPPAR